MADARSHIVREMGMRLERDGNDLRGFAPVVPELCTPGTDALRISVLALWSDIICGLMAGFHIGPRVPVTLDLSVELFAPPVGVRSVEIAGQLVKLGRSVLTLSHDVLGDGSPLGYGTATFMLSPDESLLLPPEAATLSSFHDGGERMTKPYAERASCVLVRPGVASLPRTQETTNASNTINGGIIALAAEEAALSLAAPGSTLTAMSLRYLRPARVGPAVASAVAHGDHARVEVRDSGSRPDSDRLCVLATTRSALG